MLAHCSRQLLSLVPAIAKRAVAFVAACIAISAICFIPRGYARLETWTGVTGFQWGPYWEELSLYLSGLLQGDLGVTFIGTNVADEIARTAPTSFLLLAAALVWATVFGVLFAVIAHASRHRFSRSALLGSAVLTISLPDFFVIVLLQSAILMILRSTGVLIIPALGSVTLRGLILPAVTLGALPAAYIARIVAVALEETEHADFMRTAIAKGRSRLEAVLFHALRNVSSTALASLPSVYGITISGLIIVEYLTTYPGVGNFMVMGITYHGPNIMPPIAFLFSGLYFVLDTLAVIGRAWLDPRQREEAAL